MNAWIVIILLAGWLGATLIYQIFMPRLMHHAQRFDIFRLLPAYRFFAGRHRSLVLAYRDRLTSGELSPWQETHLRSQQTWYAALWNPQYFQPDVVVTLMENLVALVERVPDLSPERIQQTFPYRAIQNDVIRRPQRANWEARQFRILESFGHFSDCPHKVIFTSSFHDL